MIRVINPGPRPEDLDNPRAMELVRAARYYLIRHDMRPYLGVPVMALQLIETHHPSLTTAAVDSSWRMYFNADFIMRGDVKQVAAVIEHEVWHLLRRHGERATEINLANWTKDLWNLACDAEIHNERSIYDTVKNMGIEPICAESLGCQPGLLAEEYFHHLEQNATICDYPEFKIIVVFKNKTAWEAANHSADLQNDFDLPLDEIRPVLGEWLAHNREGVVRGILVVKKCGEGDEGEGEGEGDGGEGSGGATTYDPGGSSATNIPEPWELPPDDKNMSKSDADNTRRQTAKDILRQPHKPGTSMGGDIMDWAESVIKGKVDWRKELRSAISAAVYFVAGSMTHSWRRISRRQAATTEFRLPGMAHPMPEVAVVLDVSGSMDMVQRQSSDGGAEKNIRMMDLAVAELDGILNSFGQIGVRVFSTDVVVRSASRVFGLKNIQIPKDKGGTDLVAGFKAAEKAVPRPNIVVCLTDGYTDWPDRAPRGMKTVIGIVGVKKGADDPVLKDVPKWAKIVCIG